jgi:lipid A 4'-phosphatase
MKYIWLAGLMIAVLACSLFPELDLIVSGWFYQADAGFSAANAPITVAIHKLATGWLPKLLGLALLAGLAWAKLKQQPLRPWLFLLLVLLVGPGLVANIVLKDQWGRARPLQTTYFGGEKSFSPAWHLSDQCPKNCSFISGDGSFGFALIAPAFCISRRRNLLFWGGTALGIMFGVTRIAMGAHFFSDTVWAAILILAITAGLHSLLYGRATTKAVWREIG